MLPQNHSRQQPVDFAPPHPVPAAEPAYSEPNTYESSYTEHTDTAEPVYDQNIPAADPMQAETTENAQVEAESVAPAPENSYNSSFGMESMSSTEPFSAYGDVQPDEAIDYGSAQHNDNTGYIPKGLEPDFTSQQTTVADKATAEPQEAKTNPFCRVQLQSLYIQTVSLNHLLLILGTLQVLKKHQQNRRTQHQLLRTVIF